MKLRNYQSKAVEAIFEAWKKFKSVLVVLPTGCGKTVVFASVIQRLLAAEVKVKGEGEQWRLGSFLSRRRKSANSAVPLHLQTSPVSLKKPKEQTMFKKISGWLKALFTKENAEKVRQTVIDTASASVNEFVNDPANQAAAREAVIAVAKDGLGGNAALDAAVGRLKAAGIAAGREAATTLLRTLVQLVYAVVRVAR